MRNMLAASSLPRGGRDGVEVPTFRYEIDLCRLGSSAVGVDWECAVAMGHGQLRKVVAVADVQVFAPVGLLLAQYERLAMEAAVLAALAGLLGITLGRVWDLRSETVRWRRDQRVRVYESLAATYYAAREPLASMAMAEPGTPEKDAAAIRALDIAAEWNRLVVATWLHGSLPVTAALRQFDHQLSHLFDKARSCRLTWEEFADGHRATEENLEAFIEAVRRELKHPPLRVGIRIPRFPVVSSGGAQ